MFPSRPATTHDLEQLAELFERSNEAPYPIKPVFAEKLRPGTSGAAEVTVATDGKTVVAGLVRCGGHLRLLAVAPEARGTGAGSSLLELAETRAAAHGYERLVIAGEPGNYFTQGIWLQDVRTIEFFRKRGYHVRSEPVNLTVDLASNPFLDDAPGDRFVVAASHEERGQITRWINGEFGPIWAFESQRSFEAERPSIHIHRKDAEIRGFSAHCANNAALGTYGPAGVGRQWRRSGYGRGLLLASLSDLRARGFSKAIIQWAAALDFYERSCGATVTENFVVLEKALQ